jgi:co-chaperonin GroES (HSP10)
MQQVQMGKAIKNDQWVQEGDVPDPELLPDIKGYHILVRPVSIKAKTKGGIILPDSTKDDISYLTTVGRVLKLGELAYEDKAKFPNGKWCQVGDYICYGKNAGLKMIYQGVKLLLIFDDQVFMNVGDPTYLDTTYNLSN